MLVAKTTVPVIPHPSPSHGPRKTAIDMIVLHYTGMRNTARTLSRLCNPAAEVSAHYLIDGNGDIYALVPEERRAWHAGVASWKGVQDINSCSIGIEIANPGHEWGYRPFPEAQMQALEILVADILARNTIPANRILAHSDVAPMRKMDPGELFDWARLARKGIGLWPENLPEKDIVLSPEEARNLLLAIGYECTSPDALSPVLTAFQRHFLQRHLSGAPDGKTCARLLQVLALMEKTG